MSEASKRERGDHEKMPLGEARREQVKDVCTGVNINGNPWDRAVDEPSDLGTSPVLSLKTTEDPASSPRCAPTFG